MGYATCRKCNGSGRFYDSKSGKTFDCRACGGTGSNKNLWTTRCERCRTEIIYKADTSAPRFCRDCRDVQLEKPCGQYGCSHTIRYKVGWDNVPTYCKSCEQKRAQGWSAKTCPGTGMFGCGKLVWSPPGKNFNLCRDCSDKEREKQAAQWKTTNCKKCHSEIRYHVDWKNVPDLCKSCKESEKAKWKEKRCTNCGATVKYHADWTNPPSLCKDCLAKKKPSSGSAQVIRKYSFTKEHRGVTWELDVKVKDNGRVDVFIKTPNSQDYPHVHAFNPDEHGTNQIAVMSWARGRKGHTAFYDLPAALQGYILSLLADL